MLKEYVFVTVSLIDELEKINKSILKLSNLYKVFKYIVIVPETEISKFESKLNKYKKVEIINENEVINKSAFLKLCESKLKNKKGYCSFRKNWYYQQIIMLSYCLDENYFSNHNLIIWDADTIPLKKIKFFNKKNEPFIYGSRYEYHLPYFEFNKILLGKKNKILDYSCIVQFVSLNLEDRQDIRKFFIDFNKFHKIENNKLFVANAIVKALSLKDDSLSIGGEDFAYPEFIGAFILNKYKRLNKDQKVIKFFRNYVDGYLNFFQKIILYIFNYKHVTYERYMVKNKTQDFRTLMICIFKDFIYNKKRIKNLIRKVYFLKFF